MPVTYTYLGRGLITHMICGVFLLFFCIREYKRTQNRLRVVGMAALVLTMYQASCSALLGFPLGMEDPLAQFPNYSQVFFPYFKENLLSLLEHPSYMLEIQEANRFFLPALLPGVLLTLMLRPPRRITRFLLYTGIFVAYYLVHWTIIILLTRTWYTITGIDLIYFVVAMLIGWCVGRFILRLWPALGERLEIGC